MPNDLTQHQRILEILQNFRGIEPLKELFWSELNYDQRNAPLSYQGGDALASDPILLAAGGTDAAFHIIYVHLNTDRLLLTTERPIISRLLGNHPYTLFIFSNREQTHWHFVNVKYDDTEDAKKRRLYRRITISPYEKLRTASERVAMLDLEFINRNLEELSPLAVQKGHDAAFDVEAVTKQFFEDYKSVFDNLQKDLKDQTDDRQWAHDYSLQFLNRCMFLYFIQRKRWLRGDSGFLRTFWESYRSANQPDDSFVDHWLNVLFFEAFNNKFHGGHRQFPDDIRKALASAPYLNGGLFTENDLDETHHFQISDSRFVRIFDFLENYNFTIAEDSPLDQEVAVDPEMIGKVYESLVNVSTETNERGDAGIFYTPRTEIDLMCRLALVDNLANHLGEEHKPALYQAVFAFDPDDKTDADKKLIESNLWDSIGERLSGIAIVDPACGSGAFLVGMLQILDDLRDRANRALGREASSFDRKKAIIGSNLYGVDVMEWACHVAELRLWLALIIDADIPRAELQLRNEPLLPHFSFNIRCGDSLVQEISGINLAQIRADFSEIPRSLKTRTARLKNEKLKFFNNDKTCLYNSEKELKQEERALFQALIDTRAEDINTEIGDLHELIDGPRAQQIRLDGTIEERTAHQFELEAAERRKQIEALTVDRDRLVQAHGALADARTLPFVWDIAFVEIFADDRRGFDIVIGNPPYVRQENILDPKLSREEMTDAQKKAFNKARKANLARSVYQAFPRFFGYKREKDVKPDNPATAVAHKLDAKSDLYIYFYFHGLSLLNPTGSFCFITSNSWLDVGYGKDLQEFTLKYCRIKQIIDNRARRSFASADVNTVISLFSAPDDTRQSGLDCTARFVSFNTPFEAILDPVIFYEIETASERVRTKEHRGDPMPQRELLDSGMVDTSPKPKYTGDKWGGKYLRAPDIYWTILEKGKDKLVRLGDIAEVRFDIKTGANEFFFLNEDDLSEWNIEDELLVPAIKNVREVNQIVVNPSVLPLKLFYCNSSRKELKHTDALEYIKWGEAQGFHLRPSCRGRPHWWDLGTPHSANINCNYQIGYTQHYFVSSQRFFVSNNFQCIHYPKNPFSLAASLNSSWTQLWVSVMGRTNFGGGLLKIETYETANIVIPNPSMIDEQEACRVLNAADMLEINDKVRKRLDDLVFNALNLTQGERGAVHEAVIDLVQARLRKASSLKG